MPIYVFTCRKCKKEIEVLQGYDDKRPSKHKVCGGKLDQKFTAPSRYIGPQTIGSLAEKNASKMSDDAKEHYIEQAKTKSPKTKRSFKVPPSGRKFDRDKMNRIAKAPQEKKEKYIAGEIDSI